MPNHDTRSLQERIRDRITGTIIDVVTRHLATRMYQDTFEMFMRLGRQAYFLAHQDGPAGAEDDSPVRKPKEGYL